MEECFVNLQMLGLDPFLVEGFEREKNYSFTSSLPNMAVNMMENILHLR